MQITKINVEAHEPNWLYQTLDWFSVSLVICYPKVQYGWLPTYRGVNVGGVKGNCPPHFDRIEGAAEQWRRAALLIAPHVLGSYWRPWLLLKAISQFECQWSLLIFHNMRFNLKNKFRGFLVWQTESLDLSEMDFFLSIWFCSSIQFST